MSEQRTILVIEDESAIRRLTGRMLGMIGFETLNAEDGSTGLSILKERGNDIDAVLTDFHLPDIEGSALAVWLREQHPGIRIIYFTGGGREQLEEEELQRDDTFFLAKPFTKESLAAIMDEAFA